MRRYYAYIMTNKNNTVLYTGVTSASSDELIGYHLLKPLEFKLIPKALAFKVG